MLIYFSLPFRIILHLGQIKKKPVLKLFFLYVFRACMVFRAHLREGMNFSFSVHSCCYIQHFLKLIDNR